MDADVTKVAVIVTDGDSQDDIAIERRRAEESGIEIFVIAVGNLISEDFSIRLASEPTSEHVISIVNYTKIAHALLKLEKNLCVAEEGPCDGDRSGFMDENCFQCLSNPETVITVSNLCDGSFNCPDLTDECLCSLRNRHDICQKLTLNQKWNGTEDGPHCLSDDEEYITFDAAMICDNITNCQNSEDETDCKSDDSSSAEVAKVENFTCFNGTKATACDGIAECLNFLSEECECEQKAEFCDYFTTYRDQEGFAGCVPVNGTAISLVWLNSMCDGAQFCENFGDERGCKNNFYCTNHPLPNVPMENRCDRRGNCPDGADERNCSLFNCGDDGILEYIHENAVCDGIQDCQSGSDECQFGCIDSAFSNEEKLITSRTILVVVWIISIAAIIGCTTVVILTCHSVRKREGLGTRKRASGHTKLFNILIMSLAVSDFLVGIYALAICIKTSEVDGRYCKVDRQWRSSTACSMLGVILLIGSEQSVFTMVLIAFYRLHSIARPFATAKIGRTIIAILATWAISILIAVFPVIPRYEDIFKSSVAFSENDFFKMINNDEISYTINWLNLMHNDSTRGKYYGNTDWDHLKSLITELNPNITVLYEFGYYSSHTVCLPTFFPDRNKDKAWIYSTVILVINFIAFAFMLVVYVLLYRLATEKKTRLNRSFSGEDKISKQNAMMQRKLTWILASDFLCWMPICIMGLLKLCGVNIPNDAYLPAGLLIVPINSAMNPLLYSDLLDIIWKKFKKVEISLPSLGYSTKSVSIGMTERE